MEHRWSARKPVDARASVYQRGAQVTCGSIGDIGLEGLFVRTGPVRLRRNSLVEVEFTIPTGGGERFRIPALVTHKSEEGIGLMFHTFDQRAFRAIQALVYERPQMERDT